MLQIVFTLNITYNYLARTVSPTRPSLVTSKLRILLQVTTPVSRMGICRSKNKELMLFLLIKVLFINEVYFK